MKNKRLNTYFRHCTAALHYDHFNNFNIHWDTDVSRAATLKDTLYSLNLQQHVTAPTHIKGHTLDLVISRDTCDIISPIQYFPPVMADHNPLIFHLLSPKPPPVKKTISFRKIKKHRHRKIHSRSRCKPPHHLTKYYSGYLSDSVSGYTFFLT